MGVGARKSSNFTERNHSIVRASPSRSGTVGSQPSFCYRDDLVEGIIRMMNGPDDFVGPVNIGNPGEFTIRQLAELTIELTGSRSTLVEKPLPVDDPERRRPDITLAKRHLGWEPAVPLREGLAKTVDWFRSVRIADYRAPTPNY